MTAKGQDYQIVNAIRLLAADAVEKANSGHPGMPMGAAAMAYTLWSRHLKGSATDPGWVDRDRFVLSAGHGSMLHYALLHLFGYELSLEDIKHFRQFGSNTPGHPEYGMTPGVESTTGPLGQGISMAVGLAMAERRMASVFNREAVDIVNHYTYAIAGDGCLMEGVSSEASSLAGHLGLGKLIVLYDDNHITIDGDTALAFTEDVSQRYQAYGWQVIRVEDGNDIDAIDKAIGEAKATVSQPTLIMVRTVIGYGAPKKSGTSGVHGSPLGKEELMAVKAAFNWPTDEDFYVPDAVYQWMRPIIDRREMMRFEWEERFSAYREGYPDLADQWDQWHNFELSASAFEDVDLWSKFQKPDATRNSGGVFMNALSEMGGGMVANFFGGSADLNGSTKTYLKGQGDFTATSSGANIYYGVREHAMAAIMNGIALHGGLRPYGATFLVFSDYMKPAIRLAALMKLPVIYVFTHDSIGVGEDGPTHQPIEHLLMLRSIPNLAVFRPADPKETAICWIEALRHSEGPSALILSRQTLPALEGVGRGAHYGGYILSEAQQFPSGLLIGTGSEVSILMAAKKLLEIDNIHVNVVSMPCVELFMRQSPSYREKVLPSVIRKRVVLEAGLTLGWDRFATEEGVVIGLDHFGESAPAEVLYRHFGLTAEHVVSEMKRLLKET